MASGKPREEVLDSHLCPLAFLVLALFFPRMAGPGRRRVDGICNLNRCNHISMDAGGRAVGVWGVSKLPESAEQVRRHQSYACVGGAQEMVTV